MSRSPRTTVSVLESRSRKKSRVNWTRVFLYLLILEVASFFFFLGYFEFKHEDVHGAASSLHGVAAPQKGKMILASVIERKGGALAKSELIRRPKPLIKGKLAVPDHPPLASEEKHDSSPRESEPLKQTRPDGDLALNRELEQLEQKTTQMLSGSQPLKSCRWYRRAIPGEDTQLVALDYCKERERGLVAYNTFSNGRILCGTEIQPGKAIHITKNCNEMPRLLPTDPSLSGTGLPPIQVQSVGGHDIMKPWDCSVPCEIQESSAIVQSRYIVGTNWKFTFSMEGSHYYNNLEVNPKGYLDNHYYATSSFQSEVPLPYFSWAEYKIQEPAVEFDNAIKGASFLARNCGSKSNREQLVTDLQQYFRVDSLSTCLHNAEPPNGLDLEDKKKLQQQYLFHLAFENGNVDDYITEKLWGTFESGTLPVYYGAPNVKEHAPPHSIIVVQDFNSMEELGKYLNEVANNKALYESYHTWRKQELPDSFHRKYDFTHVHSSCRICRWAFAKKYGFGWNHTTQDVQEPVITRKVLLENGLITGIFREKWLDEITKTEMAMTVADKQSLLAMGGSAVNVGSKNVTRTVYEHDGVVDIVIHESENGMANHLLLELETSVKSTELLKTRQNDWDLFRIQDNHSRFTLLTTWDAQVTSPAMGVLLVSCRHSVLPQGKMKIRTIVESVDKMHQGGENANYYFGDTMATEFLNPLEMLYLA